MKTETFFDSYCGGGSCGRKYLRQLPRLLCLVPALSYSEPNVCTCIASSTPPPPKERCCKTWGNGSRPDSDPEADPPAPNKQCLEEVAGSSIQVSLTFTAYVHCLTPCLASRFAAQTVCVEKTSHEQVVQRTSCLFRSRSRLVQLTRDPYGQD